MQAVQLEAGLPSRSVVPSGHSGQVPVAPGWVEVPLGQLTQGVSGRESTSEVPAGQVVQLDEKLAENCPALQEAHGTVGEGVNCPARQAIHCVESAVE